MHIDTNLKYAILPERSLPPEHFPPADGPLPAHRSLDRALRLLRSVSIRVSLFSFEKRHGGLPTAELFSAVERTVEDSGLAFHLQDGRIGALVYGWRPPNAPDGWVEDRTLARLDWVFGGPLSSTDLVDVYAVHRWSTELSEGRDVEAALAFGEAIHRVRHFSLA